MDVTKLNKAQVSRLVGKSEKVIDDWIKTGVPHKKNGGRYEFNFPEVWAWREELLKGQASLSGSKKSDQKKRDELNLARDEASLKETQARTEKIEMENATRRGELAPVDEMQEVWENAVLATRAKVLAIPPKLAPVLADENRAPVIQAELETACHEVLHELAGGSIAGADSASEGVS